MLVLLRVSMVMLEGADSVPCSEKRYATVMFNSAVGSSFRLKLLY